MGSGVAVTGSRRPRPKRGVDGLARWQQERGSVTVTNAVVVAVVVVAGVVSVTLLARTTKAAQRINVKAEHIAKTGTGINTATDSVIQLNRTNETAASILASSKPLEGKLNEIVAIAQGIDGLAKSIDGTAGTINGTGIRINGTATEINGTAGKINGTAETINNTASNIGGTAGAINASAVRINGTAKDINAKAAEILATAKKIDQDVVEINQQIDRVIGLQDGIFADTTNILGEAKAADRYARCIDERLLTNRGQICN